MKLTETADKRMNFRKYGGEEKRRNANKNYAEWNKDEGQKVERVVGKLEKQH